MITVVSILTGIGSALYTTCGPELSTYHFVPEQPAAPCAFLTLEQAELQAFKLGVYELPIRATICTSAADDQAGQEELMRYVDFGSSTSVWRAVHDNPTLGLAGVSCGALRYTPLGRLNFGGLEYYAGAFDLLVVTSPGGS